MAETGNGSACVRYARIPVGCGVRARRLAASGLPWVASRDAVKFATAESSATDSFDNIRDPIACTAVAVYGDAAAAGFLTDIDGKRDEGVGD